jgi:hypothetical protein
MVPWKKTKLAVVFMTACFVLMGCQSKTETAAYTGSLFSVELAEGWTVEEVDETGAIAYLSYNGTQAAAIDTFGITDDPDSVLMGAHNEISSEEEIPLENNSGTLTKLVCQWQLSAAQEIASEEQPEEEIHYLYRTAENFVLDITIEDASQTEAVEGMLKTLEIDTTSEAYQNYVNLTT